MDHFELIVVCITFLCTVAMICSFFADRQKGK